MEARRRRLPQGGGNPLCQESVFRTQKDRASSEEAYLKAKKNRPTSIEEASGDIQNLCEGEKTAFAVLQALQAKLHIASEQIVLEFAQAISVFVFDNAETRRVLCLSVNIFTKWRRP